MWLKTLLKLRRQRLFDAAQCTEAAISKRRKGAYRWSRGRGPGQRGTSVGAVVTPNQGLACHSRVRDQEGVLAMGYDREVIDAAS